jgi:multiple sugar transport system permease protein
VEEWQDVGGGIPRRLCLDFAAAVLTIQNRTLTAFLLQSLDVSPLPLKFAGGAVLVLPALIFIFAVRKYLFAMWGIANR